MADDEGRDEDVRRTTREERDRAAAVSSVGDETRVHTGGDETDIVQGPGGELRNPHDEDTSASTEVPSTADEADAIRSDDNGDHTDQREME